MASIMSKSKKLNMIPSILIGDVVALIVCLGAALIYPMFVLKGGVENIWMKTTGNIVHGIAVFAAVLVSGLTVEGNKCLTAFLCLVTLTVFMVMCDTLFFAIDTGSIIRGIVSSVSGMIIALFLILTKNKVKRNIRKRSRSR